jgi:hypothetical protein
MTAEAESAASAGSWAPGRRTAITVGSELAVIAALYGAYQAARWFAIDDVRAAYVNARKIVVWERDHGLFIEPSIQGAVLRYEAAADFLSWWYVWGLYPLLIGIAVWTFFVYPRQYRWARNAIFISWAVALIGYVLFPVAPPRLLSGWGFVDTVYGGRLDLARPWVNSFAAMPSMHQGFSVILGATILRAGFVRTGRFAIVALPLLMFLTIVATANHFVLDALAGLAVVVLGMGVATWWERRSDRLEINRRLGSAHARVRLRRERVGADGAGTSGGDEATGKATPCPGRRA